MSCRLTATSGTRSWSSGAEAVVTFPTRGRTDASAYRRTVLAMEAVSAKSTGIGRNARKLERPRSSSPGDGVEDGDLPGTSCGVENPGSRVSATSFWQASRRVLATGPFGWQN